MKIAIFGGGHGVCAAARLSDADHEARLGHRWRHDAAAPAPAVRAGTFTSAALKGAEPGAIAAPATAWHAIPPPTQPPPPPRPRPPAPRRPPRRARDAAAPAARSPGRPVVPLPSDIRPNRAFAWPATPSQAGAEGLPLCAALALRAAAQRDNGRTM